MESQEEVKQVGGSDDSLGVAFSLFKKKGSRSIALPAFSL